MGSEATTVKRPEPDQHRHPYSYNLHWAAQGKESHEQIPFTAAEALQYAKEFNAMSATLDEVRANFGKQITALTQRAEAAEAVVEKLPVTADGVPMFVGMEVWLPGFARYSGYVEFIMGGEVAINDMITWPSKDLRTIEGYTVRYPGTLYSTREAAEAARGAERVE